MAPTLAGFIAWVRTAMGITTAVLPDDSMWFVYAYNVAIDTVNLAIQRASCTEYMLAVYNLGGSNLINYAQDLPGAPAYEPGENPLGLPFFAFTRSQWDILGFSSGVVQATSDETTSTTLLVPDSLKNLTLADLQHLKDPFGRTYLNIAQKYGPAAWGIS